MEIKVNRKSDPNLYKNNLAIDKVINVLLLIAIIVTGIVAYTYYSQCRVEIIEVCYGKILNHSLSMNLTDVLT